MQQLVVGSPEESSGTGKTASGAVYLYAWDGSSERFALRGVFCREAEGLEGRTRLAPGSARRWPRSNARPTFLTRSRAACGSAPQGSTSKAPGTPDG